MSSLVIGNIFSIFPPPKKKNCINEIKETSFRQTYKWEVYEYVQRAISVRGSVFEKSQVFVTIGKIRGCK